MGKNTHSTQAQVSAFILIAFLLFISAGSAAAKSIPQEQAEQAVIGWLNSDDVLMGASIGWSIDWTDAYADANGVTSYYIVYLLPSGFVIVSADDLVEPIIGFVPGYEYYDPSPDNALGALVSRDLPARTEMAKELDQKLASNSIGQGLSGNEVLSRVGSLVAKVKWRKLQNAAVTAYAPAAAGVMSVSDIRVAPLLWSTWGQDYVGSSYCFNYYTPNHYYDGCVATAMAQFMRYWQWPATGIGVRSNTIRVSGVWQTAATRGADGAGGAYQWGLMDVNPLSSMGMAQRQAIGSLCYDAGVAANMQYGSGGSGAYMHNAKAGLVNVFKYSNAVMGGNEYSDIGSGLITMMNSNLDAGNPVLLAIYQYANGSYGAGHAIVADGYGYNSTTLYHHLNLGWNGAADAWYNLPTVNTGYYTFNIVVACIYNIFTTGSGEIISGRITHTSGVPVAGATITASGAGGPYTAISNGNGIYALAKVQSNSIYMITAAAPGCTFETTQTVTTGFSADGQITTGNRTGINFVTSSDLPAAPAATESLSYPASSATGKYTITWAAATGASAYELLRSADAGKSWRPLYIGADTSYADSVTTGTYRYCVRSLSGGGVSEWTIATQDCTVYTAGPGAIASIAYPVSSTTGKYTISWGASSGATSYILMRSANSGTSWVQIYSGANTSFSENAATGKYRYAVKGINAIGSGAVRTGTTDCVVTLIPAAPASISYPASSTTGKYAITWKASNGAASYQLRRSANNGGTWVQIYSGAALTFSDTVASGTYMYSVRATNTSGSSAYTGSATKCAVLLAPAVPASITYPTASATGIYTINWPAAKDAKTYVVMRSANAGLTWVQIYSGASPSAQENVIGGNYIYRVRSTNATGSSAWRTSATLCRVAAHSLL